LGLIAKSILPLMHHLPRLQQPWIHGAVVHGSHKQATPDQLPSPTAGSRPQIHRLVTQANPLLPLLFREQGQEGFVQLESGTAWRLMGKLQPHNPVMMDGAIVRCAVAHEYPTESRKNACPQARPGF